MPAQLRIYAGNRLQCIVRIKWIQTVNGTTIYAIHQKDLPTMPEQDTTTNRRRRRNRNILDRFADPEAGFPILRSLIQKFAPILIEYLMKQLPIWLADVEDLENDQTVA